MTIVTFGTLKQIKTKHLNSFENKCQNLLWNTWGSEWKYGKLESLIWNISTLALPYNISKCIEVEIHVQVQVVAEIFHELLELSHVLNRKKYFSKLRPGYVIKERQHIRVGDDSVEKDVQLTL